MLRNGRRIDQTMNKPSSNTPTLNGFPLFKISVGRPNFIFRYFYRHDTQNDLFFRHRMTNTDIEEGKGTHHGVCTHGGRMYRRPGHGRTVGRSPAHKNIVMIVTVPFFLRTVNRIFLINSYLNFSQLFCPMGLVETHFSRT